MGGGGEAEVPTRFEVDGFGASGLGVLRCVVGYFR